MKDYTAWTNRNVWSQARQGKLQQLPGKSKCAVTYIKSEIMQNRRWRIRRECTNASTHSCGEHSRWGKSTKHQTTT